MIGEGDWIDAFVFAERVRRAKAAGLTTVSFSLQDAERMVNAERRASCLHHVKRSEPCDDDPSVAWKVCSTCGAQLSVGPNPNFPQQQNPALIN